MSNQNEVTANDCNEVEDLVEEIEQLVSNRNSSNENKDTILPNVEEERYINIAQESS